LQIAFSSEKWIVPEFVGEKAAVAEPDSIRQRGLFQKLKN
jgi:hypothetical protein